MSVGTHSETSFGRVLKLDAESGVSGFSGTVVSAAHDSDRLSKVYTCTGTSGNGACWWNAGDNGWNITGYRTASFWARATASVGEVSIHVILDNGDRKGLYYRNTTGTPFISGSGQGFYPLGGTSQNFLNKWTRVERNLQSDITALWPGRTLSKITGIYLYDGSQPTDTIKLDDLAFSNSLTVEHNTLAPGVIGHIARNRTINQSTYAATDRWFHYDQVGSVMCTSDAAGELASTFHPDAFGNMMASWQTGLWTDTYSARAGWHHNTKELDADTGLVYMHTRWYASELGIFMSSSPLPSFVEHEFLFVESNPMSAVDPAGLVGLVDLLPGPPKTVPIHDPTNPAPLPICTFVSTHTWSVKIRDWVDTQWPNPGGPNMNGQRNAFRHCLWQCTLAKQCGDNWAEWMGWGHEFGKDSGDPDTIADIQNNATGRRYAASSCEPIDCYRKCRSGLSNGDLNLKNY